MVKITVDMNDFTRIMNALDKVDETVRLFRKSIPKESAQEYIEEVKNNIVTQKFGDFGKPRTSDWKKGYETENLFWNWLGTVFKSLSSWQLENTEFRTAYWAGFKFTGGGAQARAEGGRKTTTRKKSDVTKSKPKKESIHTKWVRERATVTTSSGRFQHLIGKPYTIPQRSTSQSLGDPRKKPKI